MVGAIQTFGRLIPPHPHIHALVAEGVFLPESGAFLPLPKLATGDFHGVGRPDLLHSSVHRPHELADHHQRHPQ